MSASPTPAPRAPSSTTTSSIQAFTRRLSHVDQNYVRTETIPAANAVLVEAQGGVELAQSWGGGQQASADGLHFVVRVRTINAGPNPRYSATDGVSPGSTTSPTRSPASPAVLVPGTLRDSLFILNGLLDNETAVQPAQVTTDTASYSEQVFGLFHLLGYQFSPRLADLADQRFWRIDRAADYGPLNAARNR